MDYDTYGGIAEWLTEFPPAEILVLVLPIINIPLNYQHIYKYHSMPTLISCIKMFP